MGKADLLSRLERTVLPVLEKHQELAEIVKASGLKDVEVMRALQWLENKDLIKTKKSSEDTINLDKNGIEYLAKGLPERRLLNALVKGSLTRDELIKKGIVSGEEFGIALGILKQKHLVLVEKEGKALKLTATKAAEIIAKDELAEEKLLKLLPSNEEALNATKDESLHRALDSLKKRKNIIKIVTQKSLAVTLSPEAKSMIQEGISTEEQIETLTPGILKTREWKKKAFRPYDVSINVPRINRGKTHFVNDAISYVKRIWLDLGFKEMTGDDVQTAFWDLDALFVPQDHPAREMQDTYYLKEPSSGKVLDKEKWKRVKAVHENGGDTGSKGWGGTFNEELAIKNLLRTHTTVLSARTIAQLKKEDLPAKFFVVGKVFRNEALDWKHLFEFHQVDGIVIDPNANLKHLKGYLKEFYLKMGYPDVRMRPAHFPYTEPSIEVEALHPVKKEWVEMGGAGIFRPEVTKTLFGTEIPVLAWGQGLERIISRFYGITDIRELYANDLKQLRTMKTFIGEK